MLWDTFWFGDEIPKDDKIKINDLRSGLGLGHIGNRNKNSCNIVTVIVCWHFTIDDWALSHSDACKFQSMFEACKWILSQYLFNLTSLSGQYETMLVMFGGN